MRLIRDRKHNYFRQTVAIIMKNNERVLANTLCHQVQPKMWKNQLITWTFNSNSRISVSNSLLEISIKCWRQTNISLQVHWRSTLRLRQACLWKAPPSPQPPRHLACFCWVTNRPNERSDEGSLISFSHASYLCPEERRTLSTSNKFNSNTLSLNGWKALDFIRFHIEWRLKFISIILH